MTPFLSAMSYVSAAPSFPQAMTATVMCSMFIGALLYDGHLRQLWKGLVSVVAYGGLVALTTITRIGPAIALFSPGDSLHTQALGGLATVTWVTLFYVVGLLLGVMVVKFSHHHHSRNGHCLSY